MECESLLTPLQSEACLAAISTGAASDDRALGARPLGIGNSLRKLPTAHASIHLP